MVIKCTLNSRKYLHAAILHLILFSQSLRNMNNESQKDSFKPKGAMAFFILLTALGLIIWFSIYAIMLNRN